MKQIEFWPRRDISTFLLANDFWQVHSFASPFPSISRSFFLFFNPNRVDRSIYLAISSAAVDGIMMMMSSCKLPTSISYSREYPVSNTVSLIRYVSLHYFLNSGATNSSLQIFVTLQQECRRLGMLHTCWLH